MKPNGTIRYAALVAALLCATVTSCRRAAGEPSEDGESWYPFKDFENTFVNQGAAMRWG